MRKATRLIGIDFGMQRIGVAASDESKIIASPLLTLQCSKKIDETVTSLVTAINKDATDRQYQVEAVIVGVPLMMSGKSGLMADEVRHFSKKLQEASQWEIIMWDERLTSVQAERSMMEGNMSRKKRSKSVDTVAATIILQNYLDSRSLRLDTENS